MVFNLARETERFLPHDGGGQARVPEGGAIEVSAKGRPGRRANETESDRVVDFIRLIGNVGETNSPTAYESRSAASDFEPRTRRLAHHPGEAAVRRARRGS